MARGATCPFTHSTTAPATDGGGGATHLADCICKADYYLSNLTCVTCPNGADCIKEGARLESLPLEAGYWRSHALSEEVRLCFTADACIGTTNWTSPDSVCANGHEGAFCDICQPSYYRGGDGLCLECEGSIIAALVLPPLLLISIALVACYLCSYRHYEGTKEFAKSAYGFMEAVADGQDFNTAALAQGQKLLHEAARRRGEEVMAHIGETILGEEEMGNTSEHPMYPEYTAWVVDQCYTVAFYLLFLIYPSTSQTIFYAHFSASRLTMDATCSGLTCRSTVMAQCIGCSGCTRLL